MRVAFLDSYGRFSKDPNTIAEIRVFEGDDPAEFTSMTVIEYRALPRADREVLQLADSAAGLIDTSDKSNA